MHSKKNIIFSECGSVLVISLVILVVLTLMSIIGVQTTSLQERMASNLRDQNLAFQAAEAALREAEIFLQEFDPHDPFTFKGVDGLHPPDSDLWLDKETWENCAKAHEYEIYIDNVKFLPCYIIERLPYIFFDLEPSPIEDEIYRYRVTARAVGGSESAEVILQTTYKIK